jgi:FkbM family methyltransferase
MKRCLFETHLDIGIGECSAEESSRLENLKIRFAPHFEQISEQLYSRLPHEDRERFIVWFAKRWAGIDRVGADEAARYAAEVNRVRTHPYATSCLNDRTYKILTLEPQGFRGTLTTYLWMLGVHDFLFNQYQHGDFRIHAGDTIIDAGAFVGDTALLFHQEAGGHCSIHAFEVLEENLALLERNLEANDLASQVTVCRNALSDESGRHVVIKAPPVQGATSIFGEGEGASAETITIDDYVDRKRIDRVDLIKMDIEGAERLALTGAMDTIRRDRPRLAICLYHRWDDVIEIPRLILSSGVPYRLGFKWVELRNGWEAVLFAYAANEQSR